MIHRLAVIGDPPQHRDFRWFAPSAFFPPEIDETATVEAFVSVDAGIGRATTIGPRAWLMKSCHIGHDSLVGADVIVCPMCSVGGHVEIGVGARLDQGVLVKPFVKIGAGARCGMGAVVIRDVPEGATVVGNPARLLQQPSTASEFHLGFPVR